LLNHIRRIGLEIEGAWKALPPSPLHTIKYDGSLSVDDYFTRDPCVFQCLSCGSDYSAAHGCPDHQLVYHDICAEIASKPFGTVNQALQWMEEYYPTKTNKSCGIHIHTSFHSDLDYMRLMDKEFWKFFKLQWQRFGKLKRIRPNTQFWKRLAGENTYCLARFDPQNQAEQQTNYPNCRYNQLNYCYGKHGTLELRLLPTFSKVDLALDAFDFWVKIVESYLTCYSVKPERNTRIIHEVEETIDREVIEICV